MIPPAVDTPAPPVTAVAEVVEPTPLPQLPTEESSGPPMDLAQQILEANILVYEDIRGDPSLGSWITTLTRKMGLKNVVNVGDALGNFKTRINSGTEWDLIIVAAESRSSFSGEMYEDVQTQLDKGASAIIEVWYLDRVSYGKISPILETCGVSFQKNWLRLPGDDPNKFAISWLVPDHPFLHEPNELKPLYNSSMYWEEDAGDLIQTTGKGDAVLLAGLYPREKQNWGTLAVCMQDRLVIQTFSDHDYTFDPVTAYWENMIVNTLKARFEGQQ